MVEDNFFDNYYYDFINNFCEPQLSSFSSVFSLLFSVFFGTCTNSKYFHGIPSNFLSLISAFVPNNSTALLVGSITYMCYHSNGSHDEHV